MYLDVPCIRFLWQSGHIGTYHIPEFFPNWLFWAWYLSSMEKDRQQKKQNFEMIFYDSFQHFLLNSSKNPYSHSFGGFTTFLQCLSINLCSSHFSGNFGRSHCSLKRCFFFVCTVILFWMSPPARWELQVKKTCSEKPAQTFKPRVYGATCYMFSPLHLNTVWKSLRILNTT